MFPSVYVVLSVMDPALFWKSEPTKHQQMSYIDPELRSVVSLGVCAHAMLGNETACACGILCLCIFVGVYGYECVRMCPSTNLSNNNELLLLFVLPALHPFTQMDP